MQPKNPPASRSNRAGGIVYRIRHGGIEYLLVGPKDSGSDEWLLPKGHVDQNENDMEAALREVREETGVIARAICLVGAIEFEKDGKPIKVDYYLMEALQETVAAEKRRVAWFAFAEAVQRLTYKPAKRLLEQAERIRSGQAGRPIKT